jgi:hypothetical protein
VPEAAILVPLSNAREQEMHPTFATLLLVMFAGALVVGSMIGFGRTVGRMRSWGAVLAAAFLGSWQQTSSQLWALLRRWRC